MTRDVPFNQLEALAAALAPGDVAAVITEPALTNIGVVQPEPDFHASLRTITRQSGKLLILDKTHTQMASWGGLTRKLSLEPDIVTLGKSLGGGIAIRAYGISETLAWVMERHLDIDVGPSGLATGGTMYANALSLATARAALQDILTVEGYQRVNALGTRLTDGIEHAASCLLAPLISTVLGAKAVPINFQKVGKRRSVEIPNIMHLAVHAVPSLNPDQEIWAQNAHPFASSISLAVGEELSTWTDYGMHWDNSGKNGHYAPISWSNA